MRAAAFRLLVVVDDYAYMAGIVFVLLGAGLIFWKYPKKEQEHTLEAQFHAEDMAALAASAAAATDPAPTAAASASK